MARKVVFLDGPIGVGKTTLGRAVAARIGAAFIDGDACAPPGPWLQANLRTSRAISLHCKDALEHFSTAVVARPLRSLDWCFHHESLRRSSILAFAIGLSASQKAIASRPRNLSAADMARSREMARQGYGRRPFSVSFLETDAYDFETNISHLTELIERLDEFSPTSSALPPSAP